MTRTGANTPQRIAWSTAIWSGFCAWILILSSAWAAESPNAPASHPGSVLFEPIQVREIHLRLAASSLSKLDRTPRNYVPAALADGAGWTGQVGVHLKGSRGSFQKVDQKPSLTVDFSKFHPDQRFHGIRKIHLNNSVEDSTYLNEFLGSELFRAAGSPAPRVGFARVWLNERDLGLYVMKEGFEEEFLANFFDAPFGSLYEPAPGQDVGDRLARKLGSGPDRQTELRQLASAVQEPDLTNRFRKLDAVLDLDAFLRFVAMEVLTGHRDGYCMARNNFRVYVDPHHQRIHFFPQGMDQLFRHPKLSWNPGMAGKVAIALLETPEGQQRYEKEIALRLRSGWEPVALARRVDELGRLLEPFLPAASFPGFRRELVVLKERLAERKLELERQLEEAKKPPLSFATGVERPANWVVKDIPEGGRLDRGGPGRQGKGTTLRIVAGEKTSASWRTQVFLPPGRYRWEGSVRTIGARPLVNARRQGAALRLAGSGGSSSARLTGTSPWTELSADFSVGPTPRSVELICEFVAGGGTAEFDEASLKLTKLE